MNDRPTPKEQILNPIYDGPVEVEGFGKAHPVGHTGELRKIKEENRELHAREVELEAGLTVAKARIQVLEWQAQSRWTPTSENLPSDGSKCLIATEEGICIASYVHSGMFFSHGHRERPSHWMLLPQAPTN